MKYSFLIMFVFVCQLFAVEGEAQNVYVQLHSVKLSVGELFREIERQTDFLIVYSDAEVNVDDQVHVTKNKVMVADCLKDVLEKNGLKYEFVNNYIVLSKQVKSQTT